MAHWQGIELVQAAVQSCKTYCSWVTSWLGLDVVLWRLGSSSLAIAEENNEVELKEVYHWCVRFHSTKCQNVIASWQLMLFQWSAFLGYQSVVSYMRNRVSR